MNRRRSVGLVMIAVLLLLFFPGCATTPKQMDPIPPEEAMKLGPEPGKAMIVFMRPSRLGFAIQAPVFELVEDQPQIIGVVGYATKVPYHTDPGDHVFMVIGEAADFMYATLEAGKTYYTLVTPRMGAWKARFSLRPMHRQELDNPNFRQWLQEAQWMQSSPEAESWAEDNRNSIRRKQVDYWEVWMRKAESARPHLYAEDGLP